MKSPDKILKAECSDHHVTLVTSRNPRQLPIDYRDYAFTPEIREVNRTRTNHQVEPFTTTVLPKTFTLK